MAKRKIKPCPFCGSEVRWEVYDRGWGVGLTCRECDIDFGSAGSKKEERAAEKRFNRRIPAK